MKNKRLMMLLTVTMALVMAACGQKEAESASAAPAVETSATEAPTETPTEAPTPVPTGTISDREDGIKTYTSPYGWEMDFNSKTVTCEEESGVVTFTCGEENTITVEFVADKQPEELLYERVCDIPDEKVTRSEGYFGNEVWSFTRTIADDNGYMQYTAMEHSGGVVLVTIQMRSSGDMGISDTLSEVAASFRFISEEDSVLFRNYPGVYKSVAEGSTDSITLNADHTGTAVIDGQESQLIWKSTELLTDTETYEYTIEGNRLYVLGNGEIKGEFERTE